MIFCLRLRLIVLRQHAQISRQRIIIHRQKREIQRLKRIIKQAKVEAGKITKQADDIMSEHQPRGKWSFAKGAKAAAQKVDAKLHA